MVSATWYCLDYTLYIYLSNQATNLLTLFNLHEFIECSVSARSYCIDFNSCNFINAAAFAGKYSNVIFVKVKNENNKKKVQFIVKIFDFFLHIIDFIFGKKIALLK